MKRNRKLTPWILLPTLLLGGSLRTPGQAPETTPKKPVETAPVLAPPAAAPSPAPPAPGPGSSPSDTDKALRLNFRGVPLDMVLNYLSDAAGFIILMETEVRGKVDVWSNQPLSKDEAVDLLNTILHRNGYAAIRNGRILKIVSRDEAKTKDIPVRSGSDPEVIPKTDEMVTQVIPVRYANAAQLTRDLQPLLPSYASLTANESGNALVLTDTQSNIRRMVEIVQALDTSISSISSIKVFPLRYADAKELANAVRELFQPPTQQNNNDRRNQFLNRFFGGGGPGGFGPGGFGQGGGDNGGGRGGGNRGGNASSGGTGGSVATTRVVAVADERANSLVVSAPDDYIPTIEKLVREMDVSVADVTELRVFHLSNADPLELADIFLELFPDETQTRNNNNGGNQAEFRFNRGGRFGNNNRNNQTNPSERTKKMGRVVAVPDQRTSSLIVSAASELMPQIAAMIEQLDSSNARRQKVFVYSLENADVQQVEQIVRDMFERSYTTGNRNGANQNSALGNRNQQNRNNNNTGAGFGNSGFGNSGGFGGGGQGQNFR